MDTNHVSFSLVSAAGVGAFTTAMDTAVLAGSRPIGNMIISDDATPVISVQCAKLGNTKRLPKLYGAKLFSGAAALPGDINTAIAAQKVVVLSWGYNVTNSIHYILVGYLKK